MCELYAVEEIPTMRRHSPRLPHRQGPGEVREVDGFRVSTGRIPILSLSWLLRSGLLISVLAFVVSLEAKKPASHGISLMEKREGDVLAVAFSRDGRWLVSGGMDNPIRIWDMTRAKSTTILENGPASTFSLAFSPDGASLAAAGVDGTVRIWSTESWSLTHVVQAHSDAVFSLTFSPDGKLLATCSRDQTVRLWNTANWQTRSALHGHHSSVRFGVFSPDGRRLASASTDGTVRVWDIDLAGPGFSLVPDPQGKGRPLVCIAFSPDSRVLVIPLNTEALVLVDPASGRRLASWSEPRTWILSLAFSPNGRILAAGTDSGGIELWDVATGQREADLRGLSSVWALAFSPDGQSLASGGPDALRLWDLGLARSGADEAPGPDL